MPAADELIASGRTEDEVCKLIGADWLIYQDLGDLIQAVKYDNGEITNFDTSCFSGEYVTGDVTSEYLGYVGQERSDDAKTRREALRAVLEGDDDFESAEAGSDSAAGVA